MGGDADRTLFVGNLHPTVMEEHLFELFLQAGPLLNVKIPKDKDGKPKLFAFVNFKHEESVPYAMSLLNGTQLYGRAINIQFRSGSTHISGSAPVTPYGNTTSRNSPVSNDGRHDMNEDYKKYNDQSPVSSYQRSFSSPDNLQRQAMMNNFYMQGSHGSRGQQMGQPPSSQSMYSNNGWYTPSNSHPTQRRYDSPSGHRSMNLPPHPYENDNYRKRDLYNRVGEGDNVYKGYKEDYHYRSQDRRSPNLRNDPGWRDYM